MAPGDRQKYKVRLASGRILGPLDLDRVRALIMKNQITGVETARALPRGEWKDINAIPELADLLLSKAKGDLTRNSDSPDASPGAREGKNGDPGATTVLPGASQVFTMPAVSLPSIPELQTATVALPQKEGEQSEKEQEAARFALETQNKTVALTPESGHEKESEEATATVKKGDQAYEFLREHSAEDVEPTQVDNTIGTQTSSATSDAIELERLLPTPFHKNISREKTVLFQRSSSRAVPGKNIPRGRPRLTPAEAIKVAVIALLLGYFAYDTFLSAPENPGRPVARLFAPVKPKLPTFSEGNPNPQLSEKFYKEGVLHYFEDTVRGYKLAAEKFHKAASLDPSNVKALALLASSYLNLIDSSNKDENYFTVLSKLIEMSRAKSVDLPETVIADVEYFLTANKGEAAQNRIVQYTKISKSFGLEMFYYLSYVFYQRGNLPMAARYVSLIPDNNVFSAKVFHLRGLVAEKLEDQDAALLQYAKAIQFNAKHMKSRLRYASIMHARGKIQDAEGHLEAIVEMPFLLAPKELAYGYYLHSQLTQAGQLPNKWDLALGDIERAVKLDKDNSDYLLELYRLRGKAGDSATSLTKQARMFFFLGEGQRQLRLGNVQEALIRFLEARRTNLDSHLPLERIGDMFLHLKDIGNARENYRLAGQKVPNNIDIWSKYINTLILSYEWEEAQKAMEKFRQMNVSQSAIDKAAGDMYARQGKHIEAQTYYRKAMARPNIDASVYIAYANSLLATQNYKDAPFFYALALRFDSANAEALIGTAKCVAASESIEQAITLLQDELQKGALPRAELLAAIAEFEIQKGSWASAQSYIEQAMTANPDYAYPWKLQAQIYMNHENVEKKKTLDRALAAYKSYSDRNPSDPSGYLERYGVFAKKGEYEKASEELERIYVLYPKYPNLHYYKGALYAVQGNYKSAIEEFLRELKNNPAGVHTQVALGKSYLELGYPKDALESFNKAMQISPQAPEPKHLSGYANYLLKNYHGAIALYQAALLYDKGNALIFKRMGMAYRDMGDMVGARSAFRKYLEMEPDAPDRGEFLRYL